MNPLMPTQSEDAIDVDPISYMFPYETMDKILVDVPKNSTPKDEVLIYESNMNTRNEKVCMNISKLSSFQY